MNDAFSQVDEGKLAITKLISGVVFLGTWAYCAVTYGFLLGVGLGWIPALICSSLVAFGLVYLWGLVWSVVALLVVFVGYVLLTGCAPIQPNQFSGPNGRPAYSMLCSGMGRTLDQCYQKAGELCPTGYTVVGSETGTVGVPLATGGMLIAPRHTLAIECK